MMTASVMAEGHMKFKGVEIDGSLPNFVKQMEAQGFTKTHTSNEMVEMRGMFAGENVEIGIMTTPKSKKVASVMVIFKNGDGSMPVLRNHYYRLKESLIKKYGDPVEVDDPKSNKSEQSVLVCTSDNYKSVFETDKGRICLVIYSRMFESSVCIAYFDKANQNLSKLEAEDDL